MDAAELRQAARPEAILTALAAKADDLVDPVDHHVGGATSVREFTHAGHEVVIRTTYLIEIDGRPFDAHVGVGNDGRVHYHGLPTRDFASMVELIRKVIDQFPDDFEPEAEPDPGGGGGHGGGHGGGQGGGAGGEPERRAGGGGPQGPGHGAH